MSNQRPPGFGSPPLPPSRQRYPCCRVLLAVLLVVEFDLSSEEQATTEGATTDSAKAKRDKVFMVFAVHGPRKASSP